MYVGFAPTTTNLFNTVNDGEAPQLSSTYAGYDDGANVFPYYDDFTSLQEIEKYFNTAWSGQNLGIPGANEVYANNDFKIDKGLVFWNNTYNPNLDGGGSYNGISTIINYNYSQYIEYVNGYTTPTNEGGGGSGIVGSYDGLYRIMGQFGASYGYGIYFQNKTAQNSVNVFSTPQNISTYYTLSMTYRDGGAVIGINTNYYYYNATNGNYVGRKSSDFNNLPYSIFVSQPPTPQTAYAYIHYWFLARNVIMPSVSFKSIS